MQDSKPGISSSIGAYLAMIFLAAPLLAVFPISFTPKRFLSTPDGDWSLRHYHALASSAEWHGGIVISLLIAVVTSLLCVLLAALFSIGVWYTTSRHARLLVAIALMPMAVPPVISALALFFFSTSINLYDTLPGMIVAHTIMVTPYAVVTLLVSLSQVDRRLELAARNLGASVWQTTFWVVLPNIKFGLVASAFIGFILSWEEIAVTLFVSSVDVVTLPRLIWSGLRDNIDPIVAAVSVVLITITIIFVGLKSAFASR